MVAFMKKALLYLAATSWLLQASSGQQAACYHVYTFDAPEFSDVDGCYVRSEEFSALGQPIYTDDEGDVDSGSTIAIMGAYVPSPSDGEERWVIAVVNVDDDEVLAEEVLCLGQGSFGSNSDPSGIDTWVCDEDSDGVFTEAEGGTLTCGCEDYEGVFTPAPSSTATPYPTSTLGPTATPRPTGTLHPTLTPHPTATLHPTLTPHPTGTLQPTLTPHPSGTLHPTLTPYPTSTHHPTLTPSPTGFGNTTAPVGNFTSPPSTIAPTTTMGPTSAPSSSPTWAPTTSPSQSPTMSPTAFPTAFPTASPTASPSLFTPTPTMSTVSPTGSPTVASRGFLGFTFGPTAAPTVSATPVEDDDTSGATRTFSRFASIVAIYGFLLLTPLLAFA